MINVVSVRVGQKYSPDYVAILHDMAARNLSTIAQRHWCVTDDPDSLPDYVTAIPAKADLPGWWQKPYLFSGDMPWEAGSRILYMDLDVAVTGRLEDLAETKGIMRDAGWPCYNSSVMVWDHGEHRDVWDRFDPALIDRPGKIVPANLLPKDQINGGDQEWLTEVGGWDVFPQGWCVSYKFGNAQGWPPAGSKVVVFHGDPKPSQIKGGWVENVWKIGGFTSLPKMTGANVERDYILANVEANSKRDLPWFTGFGKQGKAAVIVCGGPSVKDHIHAIKDHRRRGDKIITVNNAMGFLRSKGLRPDAHVMLDARPENAAFVKDAPDGVKFFIASQCHPDVLDALEGQSVVLWHNAAGDGEDLRQVLGPYWNSRPVVMVPGGCTVGLRAMYLAWLSGYKRVHVYGMDGSYSGDHHHAYPQALNDGEQTLEIVMGAKRYRCARWMARQAEDFRNDYEFLTGEGLTIFVHGTGLIPDMAKALRHKEAA